ncbi:MAG: class I SAM-dependent methyltransferase [Dehalococcoidales bacterium]
MERYQDYDNFAWLYNQEWTAFAENIFPALKDIAGESLPEGARILDLCCGTGQLAKALTEKGYKVTGIDGSANQLKFARKNAPQARFIAADARTFKLPPVYDAAFSTFDALNHIMTLPELYEVFNNVYRCLKKGGIFIFDLNTEHLFKTLTKNSIEIKETLDYLWANRREYNQEQRISQMKFTIFRRKTNGWQRSDVVLLQRYYSITEVRSTLRQAGFESIRAVAADRERGVHKPDKKTLKIFYYAQKR